jgi:uncharacterized protein (TIGR02996 family)
MTRRRVPAEEAQTRPARRRAGPAKQPTARATGRSDPADRPELIELLRACKDTLEDDTPRLTLADWLERHGEPQRAEFIRAQLLCYGEEMSDTADIWTASARAAELAQEHGPEWLGALALRDLAYFERGLIQLEMPPKDFLSARRQQVAGTETAAWIESYRPDIQGKTTAERWRFLDAPLMAEVPVLRARLRGPASRTSAADLDLLGSTPSLAGLRGLHLRWDSGGVAGLKALLEGGALPALQALTLTLRQMAPGDAELLAAWPRLAQLRALDLGSNYLGAEALAALAAAPLGNLRHLLLSWNYFGDEGMAALARAPLRRLTRLNLKWNHIGPRGAADLARWPHLANLTHLDLEGDEEVGLRDAGAAALAGSPSLGNLTHLNLPTNWVGNDGARALARSRHLTGLRRLCLSNNRIGDRGALALADSPNLEGLAVLDLYANPIGKQGKKALRGRFGERVLLDD